MTEDEVNQSCYKWLVARGYHYKGVLNHNINKLNHHGKGYGQVPIPDDKRQVLIDHQGIKDNPIDMIWIEAKGSDMGMSQLLEGFTRLGYACWCGGGKGLLAIPDAEYNQLFDGLPKGYLTSIAKASERRLGLLNATTLNELWLD